MPGSIHDYALFKSERPPQKVWFEEADIIVDLGYLGIQKDEQCSENIYIPHKKPRQSNKTLNQC